MDKQFPKTCKVCNLRFETYEDFLLKTYALKKGDFSKGPKETILLYRNCDCGTTLTTRMDDRRDYSEDGLALRLKFQEIFKGYLAKGIPLDEAKRLTREELGL